MKDKIVVVTGGSNGIGKNIVETFLKLGSKVYFIDIDEEGANEILKKYKNNNVSYYYGDISSEEILEDFTKKVLLKYNKIDYLINNACINKGGILSDCSYEDFNYVLKIGISAPYMLSKLFMNNFNENGAIVNNSSTRAYTSQANTESYTATKGGVSALTHALSISLAGKVRVNSISPGWIETDVSVKHSKEDELQHPVGRVGKVSDISNMVIFLCSEKASFINGEDIKVDGGMSKLMIYNNDNGWNFTI